VLKERSDDLGTILVDKTLTGASDGSGEKFAEIFHNEVINVELMDLSILFNSSEEKSANKALEIWAEITKFARIDKSINPELSGVGRLFFFEEFASTTKG